jgi:hypothetical protein
MNVEEGSSVAVDTAFHLHRDLGKEGKVKHLEDVFDAYDSTHSKRRRKTWKVLIKRRKIESL